MSIESVMPSNHLILCRPLLLLTSIFPSIRIFSNESALHIRWPKYWSFSFSISPSNEHSGLISFRMDWLDLLAVQGTLKNFLQHHSSKPSILRHSAFFIVQLSQPYMTTGKTTALTQGTFVGKVMSLLFIMLPRFVIGTWNVRFMNQGKLEVVKQEMTRVNINIIGISKLKWTGMGEFNSDDHCIYYCGKSLRRNGVTIIVKKRARVPNAVLG